MKVEERAGEVVNSQGPHRASLNKSWHMTAREINDGNAPSS